MRQLVGRVRQMIFNMTLIGHFWTVEKISILSILVGAAKVSFSESHCFVIVSRTEFWLPTYCLSLLFIFSVSCFCARATARPTLLVAFKSLICCHVPPKPIIIYRLKFVLIWKWLDECHTSRSEAFKNCHIIVILWNPNENIIVTIKFLNNLTIKIKSKNM